MNLKYKTTLDNLQSSIFHPLSKNGPFIDAHFGPLTDNNPVGQTYYIRPITQYIPPCENNLKEGCGCGGKGEGRIKFILKKCFPSTHFNTNSTSQNFSLDGEIEISPFEWDENGLAKIFKEQNVDVNLKITNNTGLELVGLHIHDGVNKGTMAGFSEISYFLTTSSKWQNRYNIKKPKVKGPLPHNNMVLKNPIFLMNHTKISTKNKNRRSHYRRSHYRRSPYRRSPYRRSHYRRNKYDDTSIK